MKKLIVEVSARHLHISKKDLAKLFNKNYTLKKSKDISQPGQFACKETLEVIGPKNSFKKVRIVGPERKDTQIELSITDCVYLGIKPVIRLSGNIKNTPGILLKNKNKKLKIKEGVIVAKRHLHISSKEAKKLKLKDKQKIQITVKGKRASILKEVIVRFGNFKTRLHLDTDEINALGIKNGSKVELNI